MEDSNLGRDPLHDMALTAKVQARHEQNHHSIWTCFLEYNARPSDERAARVADRFREIDHQLHKDFERYLTGDEPRERRLARPMTKVVDFVDLCRLRGFEWKLEFGLKKFLADLISLEVFQGAVRRLCFRQLPDGPILGGYFMNQFVAQ